MHEALCRPSGTTLDIVHAERRVADHRANFGPDDRYGAGELMVTLATALQLPARDHGLTAAVSDRYAWVLNNRKRTRGLTDVPA
jgi:hypothetical protein